MSSRICAWIVTSSAVVGSSAISSARLAGERHRDHHALAHAARQLVRVLVDARLGARGCRPCASISIAMRARLAAASCPWWSRTRLDDLVADREDRVQRRHRLLEDHRDLVAADRAASRDSAKRERGHVAARDRICPPADDAPGGDGDEPHDRERGDALAAARLADDARASRRARSRRTRRRPPSRRPRRCRSTCADPRVGGWGSVRSSADGSHTTGMPALPVGVGGWHEN